MRTTEGCCTLHWTNPGNSTLQYSHCMATYPLSLSPKTIQIRQARHVRHWKCNILTFDRAVNQEIGASGRRYRGITLTCGHGWIRCKCNAHKKQVGVGRLYNQVPQMAWVSWSLSCSCSSSSRQSSWSCSSRQWVPFAVGARCRSESQHQTEGFGPQDPGWAAQQNEEEVPLWSEELGVNMWPSIPSPTHLSHITNINPFATLSRIKCERYIFLKSVFIHHYCWLCFRMYMYKYSCIMAVQQKNSSAMVSYGPLHMDTPVLADQQNYSSTLMGHCVNTILPRTMANRGRWWERVTGICAVGRAWH